jgi:ribosomal protein S18 acetylase RimI-like enzyme
MIRAATPADTDALCRIAAGTGVFYDHEIVTLRDVLDDYHTGLPGHLAIVLEDSGVVGFAYFAEVEMTDRTWELWWIAVDAEQHGAGHGRKLMAAVETMIREENGRLLLIETSSLPKYEPTRRFYLKLDYAETARVPDFYRAGDDKVIFWKQLASQER